MRKNSLNAEIWKYFFLFAVLILGFLWLSQVLFLNSYYKSQRINDIRQVVLKIKKIKNIEDYEKINDLAIEKEVCVEITDNNLSSIYYSSFFGKGCVSSKNITNNYKFDFINSNLKSKTYEVMNNDYDSEALIYALKLDNNKYVFANSALKPIDATAKIIKKQLVIITFIILLLAFVLTYFISSYISRPIVKMNMAAKKLANNDFNVNFDCDNNILEIKELAQTLNYAKNELSKTDELRRDLMANVSHDLKTPLTMIKAYAEMSRDLHQEENKRKENMNIIIDEVDRLTVLVNDILTLSSMQSNILNLEIEEFDLVELIETVLKRYSIFAEVKNYKFIFNHKNKKLQIKADKKKIEQVIYNLVNNAINYTGEDLLVKINLVKRKEDILVEICDTGKGISDLELPYIWDKYYKSKKNHQRNIIGTGLGLSIVKNILELHKYEYGVKSSPKGTTFYFYIKN